MDPLSILLLLIISTTSFFTILLIFKARKNQGFTGHTPLRSSSYPLIGNLLHFIKNSNRFLEWTTDLIASSPTATVTIPPLVFTANPSNIEHVVKTRFTNYDKGDIQNSMLQDFLGHSILNTDGELWKSQRRDLSIGFSTKSLRAIVLGVVEQEVESLLMPLLARASRTREVVDLQDVLDRLAFDNICTLVLGANPQCLGGTTDADGERFFHAFAEAEHLSLRRFASPFQWIWKLKRLLKMKAERRLVVSVQAVHRFLARSIRQPGLLLPAQKSDEFLRDNMTGLVMAGRDTTPSTLVWFFWIVSSRPDVLGEILDEVRLIRSRREGKDMKDVAAFFTLDEIQDMHYLHSAISESMRLRPPVPLMPKECQEDDVLPDGTWVRKGWTVMYSSYAMGRMESIWGDDCMEFKPGRWLKDGLFVPRNAIVYPVFHAGPRMCLGKDLAYIQTKALAARILERFEMEVMEERGKYHLSVTMRMVGGLPIRIKERT